MSKVFATTLLLFGMMAWAQAPTSEFTGSVTDATGAAVAGSTITITNLATNVARVVTTNNAGIYVAPGLPPGKYSLRVATTGFRSELVNSIEVQVGQVAKLDFRLEVGNLAETVEVSAAAPTLDTETSSIGTVVENKRIVDLPLNGRNYLQLASLVPGVTTYAAPIGVGGQRMGGSRNDFALNAAGSRTQFNHYTLDGMPNTDPNFGTYLFQPSIDALQEFKVELGSYSAELGHGLSQVNVITRSGGNQYHGVLFEFLRNAKLDAKNFFDKPDEQIPPFKRNQFGFTLGGPVRIPKLFDGRNKLFFFFNYEGLRQRKAQTSLSTMPFATDRTGDFSRASTIIYDPRSKALSSTGTVTGTTAFPGNTIPADRIHPIARYLWDFYPLPNRGVTTYTNNYISNEANRVDYDQQLARVDWAHKPNSNFQFRYSHGEEPQYLPAAVPNFGTVNTTIIHLGMLGHTWAISSNMVNEFKGGVSRLESYNGNLRQNNPAFNFIGRFGIQGLTETPLLYGIPFVNISQFGSIGDPANGPYNTWNNLFHYSDTLSWNKGKHSWKFGVEFRRTQFNISGNDVARGRFTFNGQYSSLPGVSPRPEQALSDFLLGVMSGSESQTGLVVSNLRNYSANFFIQDQWKVTPKLTLSYGLRYELEPGYKDKYDRLVNVDFRWDNSMPITYVRAGTGDPYEGNPPFVVPASIPYVRDGRFGDTTNRFDKNNLAPRVGLAYSLTPKTVIRAGAGIYYVHDIANALFDVMRNPPFTLRRQESSDTRVPDRTWQNPFLQLGVPTLIPAFQWWEPTTYIPQWSLGVQRQLAQGTSLEVGYVGSSGVYLERMMFYNDAVPGTGNRQLRQPFTHLGFVQLASRPGHSSYHALTARFQRRFASGLTLLSSYTYGKSIDNAGSGVRGQNGDAGISNNYNLAAERGLSIFDFRQRLTTSFLYELPFGKGSNKVVNAVAGGWQLGGIFTLQSGFPFTVGCSNNNTYQNTQSGCRADAVGIDPKLSSDARTLSNWFNKTAFVDRIGFTPGVGPFRFGNTGRNNVTGPGIVAVDASVGRSFHFSESTRLELRGEFFNLPNHPIFGQPGSTVGNNTYAVIGSTRIDSRQIQLGLKLYY